MFEEDHSGSGTDKQPVDAKAVARNLKMPRDVALARFSARPRAAYANTLLLRLLPKMTRRSKPGAYRSAFSRHVPGIRAAR
jgi:hypothetical protein